MKGDAGAYTSELARSITLRLDFAFRWKKSYEAVRLVSSYHRGLTAARRVGYLALGRPGP